MIDARGYSCPTPVVMVQNELKRNAPASLEVMVDAQCSVENITRFASSKGYKTGVEKQGADFLLKLSKQ